MWSLYIFTLVFLCVKLRPQCCAGHGDPVTSTPCLPSVAGLDETHQSVAGELDETPRSTGSILSSASISDLSVTPRSAFSERTVSPFIRLRSTPWPADESLADELFPEVSMRLLIVLFVQFC